MRPAGVKNRVAQRFVWEKCFPTSVEKSQRSSQPLVEYLSCRAPLRWRASLKSSTIAPSIFCDETVSLLIRRLRLSKIFSSEDSAPLYVNSKSQAALGSSTTSESASESSGEKTAAASKAALGGPPEKQRKTVETTGAAAQIARILGGHVPHNSNSLTDWLRRRWLDKVMPMLCPVWDEESFTESVEKGAVIAARCTLKNIANRDFEALEECLDPTLLAEIRKCLNNLVPGEDGLRLTVTRVSSPKLRHVKVIFGGKRGDTPSDQRILSCATLFGVTHFLAMNEGSTKNWSAIKYEGLLTYIKGCLVQADVECTAEQVLQFQTPQGIFKSVASTTAHSLRFETELHHHSAHMSDGSSTEEMPVYMELRTPVWRLVDFNGILQGNYPFCRSAFVDKRSLGVIDADKNRFCSFTPSPIESIPNESAEQKHKTADASTSAFDNSFSSSDDRPLESSHDNSLELPPENHQTDDSTTDGLAGLSEEATKDFALANAAKQKKMSLSSDGTLVEREPSAATSDGSAGSRILIKNSDTAEVKDK